jgi:putative peptidoglycan lipid II flippase
MGQPETPRLPAAGGGRHANPRPAPQPRSPRRRGETAESRGLARATGSMALGTLTSKVTGFLSKIVLVFALGGATNLANAYTLGNTIPNAVYDVLIGGILSSVVVPLLVKAARQHADRGDAYSNRMFTLGVLVLGAVTVVATLAAGVLVDIYASAIHGAEHRVMVTFAYFFMPQIFFYGLSSLIGAILNSRNNFAAPMWTPILNNVVVIVVGLLFVITIGLHRTPATVSRSGVMLLGVGTTLGIVIQTLALIPALRQVKFRWRPRFDFRRAELAEIGRMAGWMAGYVLTTQVTFVVTSRVATAASVHAPVAGVSAYQNAYTMFLLPYTVVGVSVITALLPRMSRHAAARKYWLLREDFSYSIRLSSAILVPAGLILAVLGPALCELMFSYGSSSVGQARYIGEAFSVFSLGLVPFVIFQLMLRVFYAMHDSRTPAIAGFWTMAATVAGNYIVLAVLPAGQVVIGMAAVYGITSLLSAALVGKWLLRRVGSLDGRKVVRSLTRMHVATVPALAFAVAVTVAAGVVLRPGPVYGLVTVLVGGGGAVLLYLRFSKTLGVAELPDLARLVATRFGRPPQADTKG